MASHAAPFRALLAWAGIAAAGAAAPAFPHMEQLVTSYVNSTVAQVLSGDVANVAVRDIATCAWTSLHVPGTIVTNDVLVQLIDLVMSKQLRNGQWPWLLNDTTCTDANSVQFVSLPLLRLLTGSADALPAGWIQGHAAQLELGAAVCYAEAAFEAYPYYTNIATMRLVNLHLYAQVTGNATVAGWAAQALGAWTAMVDGAGIHEYTSPTYTPVALVNLYSGLASITNATARSILARYTSFIEADAAASYYPPALTQAGPHSRDYDFIGQGGAMDWANLERGITGACAAVWGQNASVVGSNTWVQSEDGNTMAQLYVAGIDGEVPPAAPDLFSLACGFSPASPGVVQPWRTVAASFSTVPGQVSTRNGTDRYVWISRNATLGTASAYYGQQDKEVVGQLPLAVGGTLPPSAARIAQTVVVLDRFDSPYGQVKTPDGSGQKKPTHLQPTVATVQAGPYALALFDLWPEFHSEGPTAAFDSIAANVILPTAPGIDAIYAAGERVANVTAGAPTVAFDLGRAAAVRSGGGVLAFRVFRVDHFGGYARDRSYLHFDGPPGSDAGRLTTYLYEGPNITFATAPNASRVGILLAAGDADSDEAALVFATALDAVPIIERVNPEGVWEVAANVTLPAIGVHAQAHPWHPPGARLADGVLQLGAALDLKHHCIAFRRVDGQDMRMPPPGGLQVEWADGASRFVTPAAA